jgi:predicted flap endonuclease-1-like 5' DNA nuclease/predicted  nucleic acid-binding Zn-ribbon protein
LPEITVAHIALFFVALIIGIVIGWSFRGSRSASEKTAINIGWHEQLAAQRIEHERLSKQNQSLMEQNNQFQASDKDAKMRASELSGALKETFERRDELQRQIKDIRANLETVVTERNQLQNDMQTQVSQGNDTDAMMRDKDERIETLNRELGNWRDRLPPLIERFRQRNADAEELEQELAAARKKIVALETMVGSDQTRVEPVDPDALKDGMNASNEPIDENSVEDDIEELITVEEMGEFNDDAREDDVAVSPDDDELDEAQVDTNNEADNDFAAQSVAPADNLKLIKGIGPAIEKTLNEMGVFRFNQIAEMSEYDIDRVAHRLKGFRSRIYREDWIGQARDLYDQKVNGQL